MNLDHAFSPWAIVICAIGVSVVGILLLLLIIWLNLRPFLNMPGATRLPRAAVNPPAKQRGFDEKEFARHFWKQR